MHNNGAIHGSDCDASARLTPIERVLRLATDIRAGEGTTALLMFTNVFVILCAYYLVKPLREGWISISDVQGLSKMEIKAYTSFAQSMILIPIVAYYGRLAERMPRARLITLATLFCMSNMIIFWALQPNMFFTLLPGSGVIFYIWVGMFGVFVVAQFWAYAADLYDQERGRRLIPLIAIGATSGAAFGSWLTSYLIGSDEVVKKSLLLAALVPLAVSVILTQFSERRGPLGQGPSTPPPPPREAKESKALSPGSLAAVLKSRYLLPVALITLLMNWVNTNGENVLFHVIQGALTDQALAAGISDAVELVAFRQDGTTAFYGDFFFFVNVVALLLQTLVASRLLRYGGFGALLMLTPAIALMGYAVMALIPVLAVIKIMKIAENATDYSINNTARHVLWLPVPSTLKFKGKPTIDSLFARLGDFCAALTVLFGVQLLHLSTSGFLGFTAVLVLIWIVTGVSVVRGNARLSREPATPGDAI